MYDTQELAQGHPGLPLQMWPLCSPDCVLWHRPQRNHPPFQEVHALPLEVEGVCAWGWAHFTSQTEAEGSFSFVGQLALLPQRLSPQDLQRWGRKRLPILDRKTKARVCSGTLPRSQRLLAPELPLCDAKGVVLQAHRLNQCCQLYQAQYCQYYHCCHILCPHDNQELALTWKLYF